MTFKFPGMDRLAARGKTPQARSVPSDARAGDHKAKGAFGRLSLGRRPIPQEPQRPPLSAEDRKTVASVVEEITGKRPKGRVNDPEVNQRLNGMFGGAPVPVGTERPPPERPPGSHAGRFRPPF